MAGKKKTGIIIGVVAFVLVAAIAVCAVLFGIPMMKYSKANSLYAENKYEQAIAAFRQLGDYRDSKAKVEEIKEKIVEKQYDEARDLFDAGKYESAMEAFEDLGKYKNSEQYIDDCYYYLALERIESKEYDKALELLEKTTNEDADAQKTECQYQICLADKTNSDEIHEMLLALHEKKYKDTDKMLRERFPLKVTLVVNTSKEDDQTPGKTFGGSDTIYCHFKLIDGVPGENIILTYEVTHTDGTVSKKESKDQYCSGESGTITSSMSDGAARDPGTMKYVFYDPDGNKLGEASITVG